MKVFKCLLSSFLAVFTMSLLCFTALVNASEPLKLYGGGVQSKVMESLSNKLCGDLIDAQEISGENSAKVLEKTLIEHLSITKSTSKYKTKLTKFWNKNLDQMICTRGTIGLKAPQHIMKRVIDMGLNRNVYFNFIFELDDNVKVNAIGFNNKTGKPETIIDYIDTIMSDPSNKTKYVFREIKDLKEVLIEYFDGKRASEIITNK